MAGRVEGKVALATGEAREMGRASADPLARDGAAVVAVELCEPLPDVG